METWHSALELADLVRRKEVKPLEILDAVLARLDAVNPTVNAFCLVAADVALALVLVSGAALLLRSFGRLVQVDPGFDPGGAVTLVVGVPGDERQIRKVFHAVLQRLRELPGASAAGGVDYQPLSGVANDQTFEVEGRPVPAGARPPDEEIRIVTPGWLEAMRIPLLQGRTPQETDSPDQASVAVVKRGKGAQVPRGERGQEGVVGRLLLRHYEKCTGGAQGWMCRGRLGGNKASRATCLRARPQLQSSAAWPWSRSSISSRTAFDAISGCAPGDRCP